MCVYGTGDVCVCVCARARTEQTEQVTVRGKTNPAEVVKMPFVPTSYYKLP